MNAIYSPTKNKFPDDLRQFKEGAVGYISFEPKEFEKRANEQFQTAKLVDGYAPFCKHVFIENFTESLQSVIPITSENEHLLKTCYEART